MNHLSVPCPDLPSTVQEDQRPCQEPSELEVHTAIRKLKNGKAPGLCGITAEMLKASGDLGILWLTSVIKQVWQTGVIPPDWRNGIILPICKGKGSPKDCKNYRGISLLSTPGKVFAIVLLNKVRGQLLAHRRVQQSGFTPGRSTTDRIFTLNTIIQSRKEFQKPLWIAFVDLKAAFDSVDRMTLWKLLRSLSLHSRVVDLMEGLYTDTFSCVNVDDVMSDWFAVGSGVRQGCRIAPDLFLGPMDHMMEHTVHRGMTGVTLEKEVFTDLDFVDDVSMLSEMMQVLVLALTVMQKKASTFGLRINWSKTKILQVPSSSSSSTVQVADGHVEVVRAFVYLECLIDSSGGSRGEVLHQIGIARSCMNMLDKRIWKSSIRLETKLHLYQTYIVPVLMYGCETWATTKYLLSRLDAFDTWALRKISRIPYTCHVSNAEVRKTTGCSPLSHLVTNRRLRLFSHIARSSPREDHHRALAVCIRQLPPDWKRPAGRPSHTWPHAIETDLGPLNFGLVTAWRKATTRDEWRHIVDRATLQRSTL